MNNAPERQDFSGGEQGQTTDSAEDLRVNVRVAESALVCLRRPDGRIVEAGLHDLSAGGALVEADIPIPPGERLAFPFLDLSAELTAIAQAPRAEMTPLVFVDLTPDDRLLLAKHVSARIDGE